MGELGLDLIARESRLGARNYEPLNVVLCRGAACGCGTSTATAASTASRLLGREPGPLPSRDPGGDDCAGRS